MNDKRLPIDTLTKLIELRNTLDGLSQVSWSFSVLNKQHPISVINEEEAQKLIIAYNDLVNNAKRLVE